MLIEASRRVSRAATERVRDALIEYDRVVFKDVQQDVPAESAFSIVRDGRTYVLAFEDPSVDLPPEFHDDDEDGLWDCGD